MTRNIEKLHPNPCSSTVPVPHWGMRVLRMTGEGWLRLCVTKAESCNRAGEAISLYGMKRAVLPLVLAAGLAVPSVAAVRPPAVAGGFYPADPAKLRQMVTGFLNAAPKLPAAPSAMIVPHAGYVFSGSTAARAFVGLRGTHPRRVIILGPSHHMYFAGAALPATDITEFATPLGNVPLDQMAVRRLRHDPEFDGPAQAHVPEHSIEVELPFLQVATTGRVPIVPILVGPATTEAGARQIARRLVPLTGPGTVVIASSDFTHYGAVYHHVPFPKAGLVTRLLALGRATAGRAAAIDPDGFWQQVEVSNDDVCGAHPIEVLLQLLHHAFDGTGTLNAVTTSASPPPHNLHQVVTYAAVTYTGTWHRWQPDPNPPRLGRLTAPEKTALLDLARAAFRSYLGHGPELANWFATHRVKGNLAAIAGAFVTLTRKGLPPGANLRCCMGSIVGREPLADAVIHAAVSASHDPRFPPLRLNELDGLHLEISVLSPLHRVPGPGMIRLGTDGVVLEKGPYRAVYLPQVARETGWSRDELLSHLAVKAGLDPDDWRSGATFQVFTAQVFGAAFR